ncbi:hypothetical protein [Sphingobium abikonense]
MHDDEKSRGHYTHLQRDQDADEVQDAAEDVNQLAPLVNVEPGS